MDKQVAKKKQGRRDEEGTRRSRTLKRRSNARTLDAVPEEAESSFLSSAERVSKRCVSY
ncbi:unnamed protein product, partial [Brassica rapa]